MEIRLEHLTVRFGQKTVFSDFSLHLPVRSHLLVTGSSGSGKSTLLKLLLGFCVPDQGQIVIGGQTVNPRTIWQLRQRIAYVPQRLPSVAGTARDLLEHLHQFQANQTLRFSKQAALAYFADFGLQPDQLQQPVRELSGGEQQRLAIISALLLQRDLLLLDEATSAVDADRKVQVMDYLSGLKDQTMIIVAHDQGWQADHILDLSQSD
ncbi:MAG: ATP-binding cassette domain-containing protein [Phaeodactylibacter sp.]|uniref:ABC transporter ATP-binding protein n=1 Tax=Phaeodactylibacter sp. TaxID=1940289 RepID=UPI0032EB0282